MIHGIAAAIKDGAEGSVFELPTSFRRKIPWIRILPF
jgi:hypothetical protein